MDAASVFYLTVVEGAIGRRVLYLRLESNRTGRCFPGQDILGGEQANYLSGAARHAVDALSFYRRPEKKKF